MKTLFILNDPPCGTERDDNALRLATTLLKREGEEVRVFLMAAAAAGAKVGQVLPQGYYSLERMLKLVRAKGGTVGVCGSCMDARGIGDGELVQGAHRSTMEELAGWTHWADRVLVF
jgi:uncharacterized protein involved in oxidation of intracellular sulfur